MQTSGHSNDQRWMRYALALASRGEGSVEPNPMVGCVIVKDEVPLGEGFHQKFGGPHAEREALASVPSDGDVRGATWYVTLEPCCHTGKTPPCTEAVIAAQPERVVVAMRDPFDEVAGRGIEQLTQAGIAVEVGVCEKEAQRLSAPYLKRVRQQKPWVIAKWAMTLDGKIASRTGDSKWISNESSRRRVHQLRGRVDAIVTGVGTVLTDDPLLTARPSGPRIAYRIVFDREATLPENCQLLQTIDRAPVGVVVSSRAASSDVTRLQQTGCDIIHASDDRIEMVHDLLNKCYQRGMTNVMLEAGGEVLSSFFEADAIDEYQIYVASKVVGGREAISPIGGFGLESIAASPTLEPLQAESIDGDVLLTTRKKLSERPTN